MQSLPTNKTEYSTSRYSQLNIGIYMRFCRRSGVHNCAFVHYQLSAHTAIEPQTDNHAYVVSIFSPAI